MHLEGLIEQASGYVLPAEDGHQQTAQRMNGLVLLRRGSPSSFEASLYEPVLCLILQGEKRVWIGEQALSFGPGECLLHPLRGELLLVGSVAGEVDIGLGGDWVAAKA